MREVPRAAEPVRQIVTSPDEELLEDHDIVEVQEPPQMRHVKRPKPFSSYTALMCDLLEEEPL